MKYDQIVNDVFIEELGTPEGLEKVSMAGTTFIRTKLREAGFARRILLPEFVTPAELYRDEQYDQLYKLKDVEPDSQAMSITLRGKPDYKYISGKRYRINFFGIATDIYEKKEEELLAYEMPITKLIEQNSVKDMQGIEDGRLISHCEAAIAASGMSDNSAYVAGTHGSHIPRNILTKLGGLFSDKQLELDTILMNKKDFQSIYLWGDLGSGLSYEVIPGGYRYETLNGIKIITTNKSDLVPAGTIYGFAGQEFFGDMLILSDVKFYIKKEYDVISFFAKQTVGMGIGNINGTAKVTLSGTL